MVDDSRVDVQLLAYSDVQGLEVLLDLVHHRELGRVALASGAVVSFSGNSHFKLRSVKWIFRDF